MKLFKISQTENPGYDTFDAAIVAAETEDIAKTIEPDGGKIPRENYSQFGSWVNDPDLVTAEYIGEAKDGTKEGTILSSFNAG